MSSETSTIGAPRGHGRFERPLRECAVWRYYDPASGQFLSVDPLVDETGYPYTYGADDPVLTPDPSGLCAALNSYDSYVMGPIEGGEAGGAEGGEGSGDPAGIGGPGVGSSGGASDVRGISPGETGAAVGRAIRWPTGQSQASVDDTYRLVNGLTRDQVREWKSRGLTLEGVKRQLRLYEQSARTPSKLKNVLLQPRMALMRRIVEIWPNH